MSIWKCSTCAVEIDKQLTISCEVVFGGNGVGRARAINYFLV